MNENTVQKIIGDLESLIGHLKEFTDDTTRKPSSKPVTETKKVSLEEVRACLAVLSRNGKTAQVKALIMKFGANKLSEVEESNYADLLKAAEKLKRV